MFWNVLKLFVIVILPLGVISGAFGFWFDKWLEKKYPNMDPKIQSRIGTIVMLGVATILMIGFFIVLHVFIM